MRFNIIKTKYSPAVIFVNNKTVALGALTYRGELYICGRNHLLLKSLDVIYKKHYFESHCTSMLSILITGLLL